MSDQAETPDEIERDLTGEVEAEPAADRDPEADTILEDAEYAGTGTEYGGTGAPVVVKDPTLGYQNLEPRL